MGLGVLWMDMDGCEGSVWVSVGLGCFDMGSGASLWGGVGSWGDCGAARVSGRGSGGDLGVRVGLARLCVMQGAMGGFKGGSVGWLWVSEGSCGCGGGGEVCVGVGHLKRGDPALDLEGPCVHWGEGDQGTLGGSVGQLWVWGC